MSTRSTVLLTPFFHLFEETFYTPFRLTLTVDGEENERSGGIYVDKEALIQFAKEVLEKLDKK